jgi:type I restriction enzyme S subunit
MPSKPTENPLPHMLPSLAKLQPNPHWARLPLFDRKGWKTVRFGEVVENLNETCDPAEAGLERVIAMEHLEPGSLHVRAWGKVADGTTFTRRCRPGQVLFGKRRAYQRKVAVAEFDAVVSGDIYVLAPKGDRLLPELLPFLCLSERFFQHAVGTSAGSLSPRTNWSSLASFEFALPPLDQQRRIAEILWAVDEALVAWKVALDQHARSLFAFASSATARGLRSESTQQTPIGELPKSWRCLRIEELTEHSAYGPRFPSSSYTPDGNVWQIRTTDFDRAGGINFAQIPAAKLDEDTIALHRLKPRDFLLSRSGEYAGLTAVYSEPNDDRAYIPGAFLIRYRLSEELDPNYLLALCNAAFGEKFVKPLATGSAQPNISGSAFSRFLLPVPPVKEQREIVRRITELQSAGSQLAAHVERTRNLLSTLVNTFN